jgi:hypothetical protein
MAKLTKREVHVEPPHDFKGEQYVSVIVTNHYDDKRAYSKTHNFALASVPEVAKKLNALIAGMSQ